MFCRCITGSGNSNVLFKRLVSSFIAISLLLCLCLSAGAIPAEGDIDLYKGVIAGYAIASGMQFYSWREVYHFTEDFYQKIITQQTSEQLDFMSKIQQSDFQDFDFYFLKFYSRPETLTAFVSAVESTYNVDLNPNSDSFSSSINVEKLLCMPGVYNSFDTSLSANSATNYGTIYTLSSKVSVSSSGLILLATNNRGVSLYCYRGSGDSSNTICFFFKLGEFYIKFSPNFSISGLNLAYIQPCVLLRNDGSTSISAEGGRGVSISDFSPEKAFNSSYPDPLDIYTDSSVESIGNYGAITYGFGFFDQNGRLIGINILQRKDPSATHFGFNTDPDALFSNRTLGEDYAVTPYGYSYWESFAPYYIASPEGDGVTLYKQDSSSVYLYECDYTFAPISYKFISKVKMPYTSLQVEITYPTLATQYFLPVLFSHSFGLYRELIGVQIQPSNSFTLDKDYLLNSNSLYNQLLAEEKTIRVPYNLLDLDIDVPDEEIPPTPPSIEDTDTPIGDISDSSQQVGDNLNGTAGSIDELGSGFLVPDIDLDGTLGNIPNDGANSISTFISMVMGPLMNYPIVTTLLLCLIGFTAIKLILYGTGRD